MIGLEKQRFFLLNDFTIFIRMNDSFLLNVYPNNKPSLVFAFADIF